jgi:hypothetical protein
VHVFRAGLEAIITLGDMHNAPAVRGSGRMPESELRRAEKIVAENQEFLLHNWRRIYEDLAAD